MIGYLMGGSVAGDVFGVWGAYGYYSASDSASSSSFGWGGVLLKFFPLLM